MNLSEIKLKKYYSPQEIFFDLWDCASSLTTFQRTTAEVCEDLVFKLKTALENDLEEDAAQSSLLLILGEIGKSRQIENGAIMALLRAIDDIFLRIHPRFQSTTTKVVMPVIPAWLRRAELKRLRAGVYWEQGVKVLIPRGPLLRVNRKQFSAGGEQIEDYFSSLTISHTQISLNHRNIKVKNLVIPLGGRRGVSANISGPKSMIFLPIAIEPADLKLDGEIIGGQGFMTSRCLTDGANILEKVLQEESEIDFLIAPEMTVDEFSANRISGVIKAATNAPRLTIAGTGSTTAVDSDFLTWNQCSAMNQFGYSLWQQRKMWMSGIPNDKARAYGFKDSPSGFYLEKNAEADEIVIADIEGFGRCCILICQDLQSKPLATIMLKEFQPDWIFCPILDPGIRSGGWAHQRAFDLSSESNARFVICSSLSMVSRPVSSLPAIGLVIGPKASIIQENDNGRSFFEVYLNTSKSLLYGKTTWGDKGWVQTKLVTSSASA